MRLGYICMFGRLCLFNNKRKICLEFSLGKNPSIYFSFKVFLKKKKKKYSRVNSDCITGNLPYLPPLFLVTTSTFLSCLHVQKAGQSCEVETLIPLIHRCNKLVLVGDPRQLPPTVKSVVSVRTIFSYYLLGLV